jgi:DNA-directed RNA polymerase specialized sigma24 family protein
LALSEARSSEREAVRATADALWPRAQAGDRAAAERLARDTYRDVFGALVKMSGDPELAADLTQETYRKAWGSLSKFNGRCRFSTWLYRIAYTTFLNHLRRPRRVLPAEEGQLDRVPDDLRYAVTARFWGEVPVREIARQQGITPPAVRKRLKRAFRRLAAELEEDLR